MTTTAPRTFPAPQAYTDQPRPQIALIPVVSNQVKAIGYDSVTQTLAVTFTRGAGAIYHYPDVPAETHDAFVKAESIGKFFGEKIKSLPFTKFSAEPEEPSAVEERQAA